MATPGSRSRIVIDQSGSSWRSRDPSVALMIPPPMRTTSTGLATCLLYGRRCGGAGRGQTQLGERGIHLDRHVRIAGVIRMQAVGGHPLGVVFDPVRGARDVVGA